MLPNVNANDGDVGEERVLVSSGCDLQTLGGGVVAQPPPARTLDCSSGSIELSLKFGDAAKGALDLSLKVSVLQDATMTPMLWVGGKILPEERVIDMATTVKLEGGLEGDTLLGRSSFGVCRLCGVKSVDICLMMFLVVKDHDLFRDMGLESIVGVVEVGESVGHCEQWSRWRW